MNEGLIGVIPADSADLSPECGGFGDKFGFVLGFGVDCREGKFSSWVGNLWCSVKKGSLGLFFPLVGFGGGA